MAARGPDRLRPAFHEHFPAKEDLLFADRPRRTEMVRALMAAPQPGAVGGDHLLRCAREALVDDGRWTVVPDGEVEVIAPG